MQSDQFGTCLRTAYEHTIKKCSISKSYSKHAMALAISTHQKFSVDIEERRPRLAETVVYFSEKFSTFSITGQGAGRGQEWFYQSWTAMESFLKLTGYGLRGEKNFTIDLKNKLIRRSDDILASIRFITFKNYLICVCGFLDVADEIITTRYLGWRDPC
jgi:phosphopantetheinyl transferase